MMLEKNTTDFINELSSKAPVPGGGGAAALAGALSAALGMMVINLTIGKKKYAQYEEELNSSLVKLAEQRDRLEQLVDEDALAFEPLSKAYSMPKDDPNYDTVMKKVTLDACKAPLAMMEVICEIIPIFERLLTIGSVIMVSDTGCGAYLAKAALESAALNIYVNTKSLKDREAADELNAHCDELINEYATRAQAVADQVVIRLRG